MRRGVEQDEMNVGKICSGDDVFANFVEHYLSALSRGEAGCTRAGGGEGNCSYAVLGCEGEHSRGRASQALGGCRTSQTHRSLVDYVFCRQVARARYRRFANGDRAVVIAFFLDCGPTLTSYGPGNTTAEEEVIVGRVDYRVHFAFCYVTLFDVYVCHRKFSTCSVFFIADDACGDIFFHGFFHGFTAGFAGGETNPAATNTS